jgi:tetratricopeptide (TPR) repeat protein
MNTSTEYIEKGIEQLNNLQFSSAAGSFEQALKRDRHSVDARIGLARIHFVKQEYEQAAQFINEALRIQPSNAEALALKGVSSMQNEKWEDAADYFEKARQADPKLQMIYVNLAKSHRKLGNLKAAEEAARSAIKLNPENDQAHAQLSAVLFKMKRRKEGIKEMIEAIRINPLYIRGYIVIGRIYQAAGKVDKAIAIYRRGLTFNPLAAPLREELAGAYAFQGDYRNAYSEAVSVALTRSIDADWLRVGIFAIALGKFEKAEKAFKKALAINANSGEAHYNLAELYFAAKLYKKAMEQYLLAIHKNEKNFKPFNGLGMLLLMVDRNNEEAKRCFVRALELSPGQKEPMLNMALACAANAEYSIALKFAHAVLRVTKPGDGIFDQAQRLIAQIQKN